VPYDKGRKKTHRTSSSTFSSFRHCSADKSIALALGTSNLRARKNLRTLKAFPTKKQNKETKKKRDEEKEKRKRKSVRHQ
jgi:hypothetical protein